MELESADISIIAETAPLRTENQRKGLGVKRDTGERLSLKERRSSTAAQVPARHDLPPRRKMAATSPRSNPVRTPPRGPQSPRDLTARRHPTASLKLSR